MLKYLNETLGLSAKNEVWSQAKSLPLYLKSGREYSLLSFDNIQFLVIQMEPSKFRLSAFQKQNEKLHDYWDGEVVLCFKNLTSYQRKALIEQGISFIVPGSQIYIPYIGVILQERIQAQKQKKSRLSPYSQQVLLYFIYSDKDAFYSKIQIAKALNISAMNVTRAVQELEELGLVNVRKLGRTSYVHALTSGKNLYMEAKPYFIDPVQKVVYVKPQKLINILPLGGESALAEKTMLNPPSVECYVIYKKDFKELEEIEIIDPAWCLDKDYIRMEVWKYDPKPFVQNGMVDTVSLISSLMDTKDERVEMMIDDLVEGL